MKPLDYQISLSEKAYTILKDRMLVYLAMEERTGKTLTAILVAEMTSSVVVTVGVITMKKALLGWTDTLSQYDHKKIYHVTNYHKAKTLPHCDLLILDEAHNYISRYPKPSVIYKDIKKLSLNKPIIYLSATPHAQSLSLLYHQLQLSSWSPWGDYSTFYQWFKDFGIPRTVRVGQKLINVYDKALVNYVKSSIDGLFVVETRRGLGFEHEPKDVVHYVELRGPAKTAYAAIRKHGMYRFLAGTLIADTIPKLNHSLYCLEGGTVIIDKISHVLDNKEKIDYILENWGDFNDTVIMYNYVGELKKLQRYFKHAQLLQATSYAEGVELSHIDNLIIYSQDYRVAKHVQRRARQSSRARKTPINVHFLLVRGARSEHVYNTVNEKRAEFVDSVYS